MKYDIHNTGLQLDNALRRLKGDKLILPKNKARIFEFDEYLQTLGLKNSRRLKYIILLRWLSKEVNKPFEKVTKEDLMKIVRVLQNNPDLSEWSKVDRKVTIKRFYKWLTGDDEQYPPEVRWIKCRLKNDRCKLPEELITEEDVTKMADASIKSRDKAFIQCLYETGCRIGELLTLQLKNINFDKHGAVLRVTGKTGDRRIRIVASAPALATWLDFHPYKKNPDAFLWVRNLHRGAKDFLPFSYPCAVILIRKLAKKAGISKRVNPHTFRHSRATALANKLTEAQMKEYFGWTQSSDMAGVYVHLSGRDIDNAILGVYDVKHSQKETEQFKPLTCARCNTTNSPGSKFCTKCAYALSADVAIQAENENKANNDILNLLMKEPQFREMMLKKLMEKGQNEANPTEGIQ